MRSFSTLVLLLVCGALACFSSPAAAEVIFQDDFDSQTLGAGLATLTPPIGESYATSNAGIIYDAATSPGGVAGDGQFYGMQSGLSGALADRMQISAADQAATAGQVVKFSLDYYVASVEGGAGAGPSIMALNTADAWTGYNYGFSWGITVNQDGSISQWAANVTALTPTGLTATTDAWIPIEVVADYGALTYTATVDGQSFSGTMLVGDFKRLEIAPNNYSLQYFVDNVQISEVPEPSTLALLAAGLCGLLTYAWCKRK